MTPPIRARLRNASGSDLIPRQPPGFDSEASEAGQTRRGNTTAEHPLEPPVRRQIAESFGVLGETNPMTTPKVRNNPMTVYYRYFHIYL